MRSASVAIRQGRVNKMRQDERGHSRYAAFRTPDELKYEPDSTMRQEVGNPSEREIFVKVQLQTQDQARRHWRTMAELRRQQKRWKEEKSSPHSLRLGRNNGCLLGPFEIAHRHLVATALLNIWGL
jgi:hypothetical protein